MLAPWLLILGLSLLSGAPAANVDSSDRVTLTSGGQGYPPK
jgi:hypothetical protein